MGNLDINEVIREVLLLAGYEINRRGIVVATELAGELPPIVGDRVQLQQVVLNLIMNSLDAMNDVDDRTRSLQIRSSKRIDCVLTQVLDCGHGLPAATTACIFDPFFTTKKNGIGMGLAISRSIIEAHGGRLWAEQRAPYGAVFSFTLPVGANVE
jgi:C4-dicarboxylate-specific signal transduction histidine kinase